MCGDAGLISSGDNRLNEGKGSSAPVSDRSDCAGASGEWLQGGEDVNIWVSGGGGEAELKGQRQMGLRLHPRQAATKIIGYLMGFLSRGNEMDEISHFICFPLAKAMHKENPCKIWSPLDNSRFGFVHVHSVIMCYSFQ